MTEQTVGALDAIERLTAQDPSDETDRALPDLRRQAFDELERQPGFPAWPSPTSEPGPAPGPRGVPEIDIAELDAEVLRRSINSSGCLLVRGMVDPGEVDRLKSGIDDAFAGLDRKRAASEAARAEGRKAAPWDDGSPWYMPLRVPGNKEWGAGRIWVEAGSGVLTADSPRMLRELFSVYERNGIRDVVAGYLGERPILSAKKCTLRRVPPDSDSHWHQDGSFLGTGLRVLNIWLTLSRCGRDAPGLDIIPRRLDHIVATGTGDSRFGNMVGGDVMAALAAETPVARPEFEPGEALLFDEMFLHSTAADQSMPNSRYAIESWFFAPSAYPDPDVQVPLVW